MTSSIVTSSEVDTARGPSDFERGLSHPAVAHCCQAGNLAFDAFYDKRNESNYKAHAAERLAYRRAMPPLQGSQNIRAFIACVTYGLLVEVFSERESTRLLYAAQVAWGTVRRTRRKHVPGKSGSVPKGSTPQAAETAR
jgi:hypothetical protein